MFPSRWSFPGACALLLALSAVSAGPALALDPSRALTQYQNDRWQTEQGLPQNTVQSLVQARNGYLWLGTMDGLARFDGIRFTVFDPRAHPELGSGSILGLMEDADGNLWIARSGAAVLYSGGRFHVVFADEVTAGVAVWGFCQAQDGTVWAATNNGLVAWKNGTTRVYRKEDGLPTDKLRSVAIDRDGLLWIGTTGGGLYSFSEGLFVKAEGLPNEHVRAVLPDPSGGVWAATAGGGLARVTSRDGQGTKTYTVADGLPTNQLSALARDAQGTLWIGTWGSGVCRMSEGRFSTLSTAGGLSADQVWSLYVDRESSLWVGTWVGGLNRLRDRRFGAFGVPEGLSNDNTRSVLQTKDGAMWVATAGGGLNRIAGTTVTAIRKADGLPSDEVSTLCEDRDGSLWIGTYTSGVARMKGGKLTSFGMKEGLPGMDVRGLYQDREGTLWAATMAGLARFDGRRFIVVKAEGFSLEGVVAMLEDRSSALWFGLAGEGLVKLSGGTFQRFTKADGLGVNKILALHEDARGSLWVGTGGGGLSRIRDGRIKTIRVADGLWDANVQTVLEDGTGTFWMTCNRGFFRAARAELDAFADGRVAKVTTVGYGATDALRSTTFAGGQIPSGTLDSAGNIWLPSYKGLVIVDPKNVPAAHGPPAVRLEEVTANGVTFPQGSEVVLPAGSGALSIRYTTVTLVDADRVRFRFRMDGLPGDWVDAGVRREAFYPSLPHGKFLFRVAASIDGKSWREAAGALPITVRPFFYQTRWFLVLAIAGAMALGGATILLRTVQLRRRHAEMERLVAEKTEELRHANERLSRLSFLDALTGLANRRRFDEALEDEWRRAFRFDTSIALVMADVDHFKSFNDALGHPEGDRCLAAIAGVFLGSARRAGDLAARYGGEEFVVLLPGTDRDAALALAERFRRDVEALGRPHPASPAAPFVTISLGVAALRPSEGMLPEALVAEADAALYRAKNAGRNRVA
ncbi:MAG: diguanylate cyclase [Acidobacteria bacterium]|nr:diguanylate cyclase [Acidobacteriota bacterium]